ncbi:MULTISPECIES: serine hydrolase [unclassified Afipia]|uniref:serine hydrolase domain-containing protein n=1 Tax=unclassified Afipia TaxID=2642050 RepID=UPI000466F63E|nr:MULTISPECIES: serine hydrolase [unclassified Afipia]MAH69193.1 serine hydrolase [Afipia sp.]OUX61734.1 MAG: serine hydrolase [Afipia sp. TMED4]HAP10812.1 serine hydrolase [Afipia sp.]HAQ93558.1 serine hydrolase [Afipia sp.]
MTAKLTAKSPAKKLMTEFPPARDNLVTLANWRTQPSSDWSFHNVRRLLPTANIAASKNPVPLESSLVEIGEVAFEGSKGRTTLRDALRTTNTKGFLVLRRGRIAAEWYAGGMDATTPHIVFSVSKSICGALGGILADKGFLNPNRPVTDYVPEVSSSVYGGCSVRHLLDMTVGISFTEDYVDPDGDVARYRRAVGWDVIQPGQSTMALREYLATQKPDGKTHGHAFHYVSTNTDLLGWVYERAAGRALSDLLGEYLWTPLGAETDAYITLDPEGAMRAAGGICAAPRDLARFGEMIRQRGVAHGRQVIPGWWIDDINDNGDPEAWARGEFAEMFPDAAYRSKFYQIDRKRRTLCCIGIHGQWIYIDPISELVIVRVAAEPIPLDVDNYRAWRRGFAAIVQHFS